MNDSFVSTRGLNIWLPGWVAAAAILIGTAMPGLGELARPIFVLGCGAVGWYAWRQSPGAHLQVALILFAFAPFVRRVVDLSIGYDKAGLMLIGPLLAILVPVPRLLATHQPPLDRMMALLLAVGGCAGYAALISLVQGDWMNAASGSLKWFAPLIYAGVLIDNSNRREILQAATSAFLVILPIIGLYGIVQYIDPPEWDRYWMQFAPIMSAGEPIPYGVRTFSTMNSPASFASFAAVGLLIICFAETGWRSVLPACLAGVALLLSLYRTSWLSLAFGLLFCTLFSSTRRRASGVLLGTFAVVALAATMTPFGDVISERVATFAEGAQDGSAQERLEEFTRSESVGQLFIRNWLFDLGRRFGRKNAGRRHDYESWLSMGIVVGLVCLSGIVAVAANTVVTAWRERGRKRSSSARWGAVP